MIPTHQMHNVLKAFSKNLVRNGSLHMTDGKGAIPYPELDGGSVDGKRHAIMEKISSSIVDQIARIGVEDRATPLPLTEHPEKQELRSTLRPEEGVRFVYRIITDDGEKKTRECFFGKPDVLAAQAVG